MSPSPTSSRAGQVIALIPIQGSSKPEARPRRFLLGADGRLSASRRRIVRYCSTAARPCNVDLCHAFIRPRLAPQPRPKARKHVSTRSRHWPRRHFLDPVQSSRRRTPCSLPEIWGFTNPARSNRHPGSKCLNQPSPCHGSSVRSMQADLLARASSPILRRTRSRPPPLLMRQQVS